MVPFDAAPYGSHAGDKQIRILGQTGRGFGFVFSCIRYDAQRQHGLSLPAAPGEGLADAGREPS